MIPIQKSLSITMCYVDMNEEDIDTTRDNEGSSEESHQDEEDEDIGLPEIVSIIDWLREFFP